MFHQEGGCEKIRLQTCVIMEIFFLEIAFSNVKATENVGLRWSVLSSLCCLYVLFEERFTFLFCLRIVHAAVSFLWTTVD